MIASWNDAAARLYGYSAVELVGEHVRRPVEPDLLVTVAEPPRRWLSGVAASGAPRLRDLGAHGR